MGAPTKSFRMALGALIIKEKLGISYPSTIEQIRGNPYLQYFIGQWRYSNELPFDPSPRRSFYNIPDSFYIAQWLILAWLWATVDN